MRSNRRRDKSSAVHEIPLQDCNGFGIMHISLREARAGVDSGEYIPEYTRRHGVHKKPELTCVRLRGIRPTAYKSKPPITRGEAAAAAGLHGESRTFGLTEFQKQLRVQRIREERNAIVASEDHIERAMAKVAFYPVITDIEKNPATVGPRVDKAALSQFVEMGQ